jgi:hypothetical protein
MAGLCLVAQAALSGCASLPFGSDPRIRDVELTPEDRRALDVYFSRPSPKAFAFAPATGKSWHAWGYPNVEEAKEVALGACEDLGSPCVLLAVNDEVVWQTPAEAGTAAASADLHRTTVPINFRSGPGTSYTALDVLPQGTPAKIEEMSGGWARVRLADGREGWLARRYLEPQR